MTAARGPIWQRIVTSMADDIRAGRLKPGDRIPTAADLAKRHGVSRSTALRAVSTLQSQGLLAGEPGRAVYVTDVTPPPALEGSMVADAVKDHEDRISALEAALLDLYASIGRPRPAAGTTGKDRRGHGRPDRPASAAGA